MRYQEFWIIPIKNPNDWDDVGLVLTNPKGVSPHAKKDLIHVVEKSAFDKLLNAAKNITSHSQWCDAGPETCSCKNQELRKIIEELEHDSQTVDVKK